MIRIVTEAEFEGKQDIILCGYQDSNEVHKIHTAGPDADYLYIVLNKTGPEYLRKSLSDSLELACAMTEINGISRIGICGDFIGGICPLQMSAEICLEAADKAARKNRNTVITFYVADESMKLFFSVSAHQKNIPLEST